MTGLVFSRARAHRLLLGAALLTVVLTTAVLATLTAYSTAIGDAALRHVLADPRTAPDTALIVKADVPPDGRAAADATVREGARKTFDGLPVTVRTLRRSGPYALPRSLQPPAARSGDPDLTHLAALDRTQLRLTAGRLPRPAEGTVETAVPQTAARALRLKPGDRLTLTDRLDGPAVRVRITGLYRPVSVTAAYWQLDDLAGRGAKKAGFMAYGPLLADSSVLTGGRVSAGPTAWLASADFARMTTARIGRLRTAARAGSAGLRDRAALHGTTMAQTSLPDVLDRVDRSLLVARSTLLIVTLQLVLLAGYALLLVARLLSTERADETRLLRARGASRARLAALAAAEALLLALPAAVCAPLLAGPLTALLAGHGPLARLGLHLDLPPAGRPLVWLVATTAALGCALAVTVPAVGSAGAWDQGAGTGAWGRGAGTGMWGRGGRSRSVPGRRGGRPGAGSGSTPSGRDGGRSTPSGWGARRSTPYGSGARHSTPGGPDAAAAGTGAAVRGDGGPDRALTGHSTPSGSATRHSTPSGRRTRYSMPGGSGARRPGGRLASWWRRVGVPRPVRLSRPASAGMLPAPLRAGADLGLLAVAAVAYWQLGRQGSGGVAADRSGALGVDPLLVAAPALALLAGTVLTLRLLPPVARFAERWAAGGRGLPVALAGWQFSRRTARSAGPVLLLVLAVALGMLAIGQAASWGRSQDDQADFRAGVPVRVLSAGEGGLGRTDLYARLPHVREAAPAVRVSQPLSGDRTATVLALETGHAADAVLMRPDLADAPVRPLLAGLAPHGSLAGARVPAGTARLGLTATLSARRGRGWSPT
ncbi:FtsX-like permease family protein [Streptomyces sp. NPDC054783]